jgi:hypothetical protein
MNAFMPCDWDTHLWLFCIALIQKCYPIDNPLFHVGHVFVTWGCLGFTALQKRHAEIDNTCLETPGRRAQQWQCTLEIHKKGPYIH